MKAAFFEEFDFNRMLVLSVFSHLSFLTLVLFLPKTAFHADVVIPAFSVSLIDLPPSNKRRVKKGNVMPQKTPALARETETTRALIEQLQQLSNSKSQPVEEPSNPLLQELDQLAMFTPVRKKEIARKPNNNQKNVLKQLQKLRKKKTALLPPPKPWKLKKPPVVEETLDELKRQSAALKKKKIAPDKLEPKALIAEETLQPPETESLPQIKLDSINNQPAEMKFADLAPMDVEEKQDETGGLTTEELLIKLEAISDSKKSATPAKKEETIPPILNKLLALPKTEKNLEIEIHNPRQKEFESSIGDLNPLPKKSQEISGVSSGPSAEKVAMAATPPGDIDSADPLSLYVGVVHKSIYGNWKTPLGEHDDDVEVSFYLYPKGNIDKPVLMKESKNENLNTLAIKAIYDSEPFPEFPEDVKESNLHIRIKFSYVPAHE